MTATTPVEEISIVLESLVEKPTRYSVGLERVQPERLLALVRGVRTAAPRRK